MNVLLFKCELSRYTFRFLLSFRLITYYYPAEYIGFRTFISFYRNDYCLNVIKSQRFYYEFFIDGEY